MNYQVMHQVGGKRFEPFLDADTNRPVVYNCPKKAAQKAKELTAIMGIKFQPRPVADAVDWKAREQKRFVDGFYKPVAWSQKFCKPDHYLHISVKDPTRVAFTKNAKDGSADIQTSMKPGKYLTEFFGEVLTPEQIRNYAMQHSTTFENKELKFATTVEDIQRVYKPKLGHSCFSGTTKANLYGSGDFAIAYIEDEEGHVTARAVCTPSRKIYVHPYGDNYRLEKLLTEAGYTDTGYDSKPWKGLKLLTQWFWDDFYTDFGSRPRPGPKDKEFFVI